MKTDIRKKKIFLILGSPFHLCLVVPMTMPVGDKRLIMTDMNDSSTLNDYLVEEEEVRKGASELQRKTHSDDIKASKPRHSSADTSDGSIKEGFFWASLDSSTYFCIIFMFMVIRCPICSLDSPGSETIGVNGLLVSSISGVSQ